MRAYWVLILAAIVIALMIWAMILRLEPASPRLGLARAPEGCAAATVPAALEQPISGASAGTGCDDL